MSHLSDEKNLLISCIRMQLNAGAPDTNMLKSFLSKDLDWTYIVELTSANRVIPFLWRSLEPLEKSLPPGIAQKLRSACNQILAHHIVHMQELKRISGLLEQYGIPFIPIKGPVLARLYRHQALREWEDIDILIQRSDVERFDKLLPAFGYLQGKQELDLPFPELLDAHHSYNIIRSDKSVSIDVHWQLGDGVENLNYPASLFWKSALEEDFYDYRVLMPEYENQLLYVCLHHGLRERWRELRLIADWYTMLRLREGQLDESALLKKATVLGIRRAFLIGVSLAEQMFGYIVPEYIRKQIAADRSIRSATSQIHEYLFLPRHSPKILDLVPSNRIWVEDNRTKARWLLVKQYLRPNQVDKSVVALPKELHFLYYLIRPVRLLRKYGWIYISGRYRERKRSWGWGRS